MATDDTTASNGANGPGSGDNAMTYRDAGVDIDAGAALVDAIKPLVAATRRPGADGEIGGFGGLFDLRAAGFDDPVLLAATDGVGTKLMVAIEAGRHDTVGIDLVAMCVNDLVVQGGEPLFFLDYYATSKLSVETGRQVIAGIAEGCRRAGAALIGGETAEMPGLYREGDYDLAGFAVGAAARGDLLDASMPAAGDVLLGLASDGIHANGFSLVRRVIAAGGHDYRAPAPFAPDATLADALLAPTRIYVKALKAARRPGGYTDSPISPAAGWWKIRRVASPPTSAPGSTFRPGRCRRCSAGWRGRAESHHWKCCALSTAGSVWSRRCRRRRRRR